MTTSDRPQYVLVFRPEKDCADPIKNLRGLLKTALRRFRLRCVSASEEKKAKHAFETRGRYSLPTPTRTSSAALQSKGLKT
jgi:hypothetical protein